MYSVGMTTPLPSRRQASRAHWAALMGSMPSGQVRSVVFQRRNGEKHQRRALSISARSWAGRSISYLTSLMSSAFSSVRARAAGTAAASPVGQYSRPKYPVYPIASICFRMKA